MKRKNSSPLPDRIRTRRNRVGMHASFFPQKKFRLRPEHSFLLRLCSAKWRVSETRLVEDALDIYLKRYLNGKDMNRLRGPEPSRDESTVVDNTDT